MKRLDIDLEKLAYDDTASARHREIEVKDKMPGAIAIILFILIGATMWGLFSVEVSEVNKAIVYSLAESLGTMTVTAAACYHGTTRGSARKDGLISRMATVGK
ncbi:MAG: hypothetical protein KQI81_05920 [Deltaproteobacteria bacterium]|nr:hypothetical protein [Deltaproteobacteria bacterium]